MGRPQPVRLVELGPGRGTLMADALRATRGVAGFHAAIDLHLVEINERLQAAAARDARRRSRRPGTRASQDVPEGPTLLVANEFFDALPVRQFERTERGWAERMVGLAADGADAAPGAGAWRDALCGAAARCAAGRPGGDLRGRPGHRRRHRRAPAPPWRLGADHRLWPRPSRPRRLAAGRARTSRRRHPRSAGRNRPQRPCRLRSPCRRHRHADLRSGRPGRLPASIWAPCRAPKPSRRAPARPRSAPSTRHWRA